MKTRTGKQILIATLALGSALLLPQQARSHCDTMDGPVVQEAKVALAKQDVTPVLKWVRKDAEPEIKDAFARTLTVRAKGSDARELADKYFFETLVRVHRAGEGAPYTGLKPAGTNLGPAIEGADKALQTGSIETVAELVTKEAGAGIRRRFAEVKEKQSHAEHSVEAGREFVAAYVEYVHYIERVHNAAQGPNGRHAEGDMPGSAANEKPQAACEHNH